jgi:hypothetical protein
MNSRRALCIGPLALLIVIAGCGGGGGYNPNNVTVTVSPAAPTVPANGQVTLTATVNGLCSTCVPTIQSWGIQEDPSNGSTCTFVPPFGPCPAGTIQENPANLLTVTYFAPSTSGTYHVSATWYIPAFFGAGSVTKVGTSVITVP